MKSWMKYALVAFVALIVGAAAAGGGSSTKKTASADKTSKSPGQIAAERGDDGAKNAVDKSKTDTDGDGIFDLYDDDPNVPRKVREEPDSKGSYELRCDYKLGDFGDSGDPSKGYKFIAGGTLENTGNIGIRVRVTYKWKLLGQNPFKVHKTYKLRRGETRDVNVSVPVTGDMIDAHQSADSDCSTHATIISTFGTTPYES